jgi:hypothetical protein
MSPPDATATRAPDDLYRHRLRVAWTSFAIGVILAIGWPIAAIVNWHDIVHSHARLGYLIGDVGLVVPLAFATWYGLKRREWWGVPIMLVLAGAGAYDLVHFSIYLWQIEAFGVPGFLYGIACAAALVVIVRWVAFELRVLRPAAVSRPR